MQPFPSLFISHGAPTFALEPGIAGQALSALGTSLPRPSHIIVLSPHWMSADIRVTASERPTTIHDFGGFPKPLYSLQYPATGDPALAKRIVALFQAAGMPAGLDTTRGLDHGVWVPLMHLYPAADVPVVQVSLPQHATAEYVHRMGRTLAPLAKDGALLIGSGSLTHNLYELQMGGAAPAAYAHTFVEWIADAVHRGDEAALIHAMAQAPHASRAHPTTEHYLPLPFAVGAATSLQSTQRIAGGILYGALSMDSYVFNSPHSISKSIED